jgi:hypothetical protein
MKFQFAFFSNQDESLHLTLKSMLVKEKEKEKEKKEKL